MLCAFLCPICKGWKKKQCSLPAWEYKRYLGFYCLTVDETSSRPKAAVFSILTSVIFICVQKLSRSIAVPLSDISKKSQYYGSF